MESPNVISGHIRVHGTVTGSGDLVIAGEVHGRVDVAGAVSVEPGAQLRADLKAQSVHVEGTIVGDVESNQTLTLTRSANVEGTIHAGGHLQIDPEAKLNGRIVMALDLPRGPSTRGRRR